MNRIGPLESRDQKVEIFEDERIHLVLPSARSQDSKRSGEKSTNNWRSPDTIALDVQADSPLGILLGIIAQLPRTSYNIVQFESGDTYKKTETIGAILAELHNEVEHTRNQTYHLMAAVVRQRGVNYDEPIMVCYLKPVFSDKPLSNWMIKTSLDTGDNQRHLVLNKQKVSIELADYATPEVHPVEMVDIDDAETLTGMKPGSINFLIEEKYYDQSFIVSLFQPDMIQMRPGETEYLGAKAEDHLDTAIIEVPLGKVGMNYSVLLDGSTFFWLLTEIQKKHPQVKFLKNEILGTGALRFELAQIAESLVQALKKFKFNDQAPILNYFNNLEKHLEHYIHTNHPNIQSDTISVFTKEFIRNFLAIEGKVLYEMVDLVLDEELDTEEKLRQVLYHFYSKFTKTEFAKNITPLNFDIFIQKVCSDLFNQGFANTFIVHILLQDEKGRKNIAKLLPKKTSLDATLRQYRRDQAVKIILGNVYETIDHPKRAYHKYEFSEETAKSEKYFTLHSQIVDLLPQFIARSARKRSHPLLGIEVIQEDMRECFYQRSPVLGIGNTTITNMSKIFIRICFGKQIQLLDIIEDKLFVCGVSVRNVLGMTGKIAPDLARVFDQDQYTLLRNRRRRYTEYLLASSKEEHDYHTDTPCDQNKVLSLLLPDLENFLNLPMMRELFGSSAELYMRLTNVLDFEQSLTLEYAQQQRMRA